MKKRLLSAGMVVVLLVAMLIFADGRFGLTWIDDDNRIPMSDGKILVNTMECDTSVIPDKYNTGVKDESILTTVSDACTLDGITYKISAANGVALDFYYANQTVGDQVEINNKDFSSQKFSFLNNNKLTSDKVVTFNNCKFATLVLGNSDDYLKVVFNNCTIGYFTGSNCEFNSCQFLGNTSDAMNPIKNVVVNNSYVKDIYRYSDSVIHYDGIQIFGNKTVTAQNIHMKNCRMEVPSIGSGNAYVNACFMVALEKSDGIDISFDNCHINGGGYSIYCQANSPYVLDNVVLNDIYVGCTARYGTYYKNVVPSTDINNVVETSALYVGSVWKDSEENIHLSVTNDTNKERILRIITSEGEKTITIPKCPKYSEFGDKSFEDFPFDLDIECGKGEWVVCYDSTRGQNEQIRFVNWSKEDVYVDNYIVESLDDEILNNADASAGDEEVVEDAEIIIQGKCGKNVEYELAEDGTLELSGEGATYNYNSTKSTPWGEYSQEISEITVNDGVTNLGTQLFRNCSDVSSVELPETLEKIGSNVFIGCSSLENITIPTSIKEIGSYAFWNTGINQVQYAGSEEEWNSIKFGNKNDNLVNAEMVYIVDEVYSGKVGSNVYWEANVTKGILTLSGTGATYNYNSSKNCPWFEYKDSITSIIVEEGITVLGSQLFRNSINLSSVQLPDSLKEIGSNAFIACTNLKEITIPSGLTAIRDYAFSSSGLTDVYYKGTEEEFEAITIGKSNTPFVDAEKHYVTQ